jgi:hypothetical protein
MSTAEAANVAGAGVSNAESGMMEGFVRPLTAVGLGAFIILFVVLPLGLQFGVGHREEQQSTLMAWLVTADPSSPTITAALLAGAAVIATWGLFYVLRKLEPLLDASAVARAQFDTIPSGNVDVAIASSAALSLFLELAVIRWQSSVLEFLAFYKNFSLLACFAGLGLGYALAGRSRIPLLMVVPLLAAQFCFVLLIRMATSDLSINPFREQLTMGLQQGDWVEAVVLFLFLAVIFLLTALTFVPIGQLCGRLMERRSGLRAA